MKTYLITYKAFWDSLLMLDHCVKVLAENSSDALVRFHATYDTINRPALIKAVIELRNP
jgi:hypothetical protein